MSDFMDSLKTTIDAINESASSAYREGYAAGRREAKMELRRIMGSIDHKQDTVDWAAAVLKAVREWSA